MPPHRAVPARRPPQRARKPTPDVSESRSCANENEGGAERVLSDNEFNASLRTERERSDAAINLIARALESLPQKQVPCARVIQLGGKFFKGNTDPMAANNWFRATEKVIAAAKCDADDKIMCMEYLFEDNASYWWESVKRRYGVQPLSWEDLKREFNDKYIPRSFRDNMRFQFTNLKQDAMTVLEYEHKFTELSTFAPMLIEDEWEKCQRFERGLSDDIRTVVTGACHSNYAKLVDAALRVEESQNGKKENIVATRSNQFSFASNMGANSSKRKGNFLQHNNRSKMAKSFQSYNSECNKCGRSHKGKCLQGSRICYYCKMPGHIQKDCPTLKQSSDVS